MRAMRISIWASLALAVGACSTTQVEQWESVREAAVDQAYTRPDVDFSNYRRLLAAPFEIYYPDEIGKPSEKDLARIRQIFRDAFYGAIGDDYEIVDQAGPDVLKVRASLVDLRTNPPTGQVSVGRRLADVVSAGHMTFLMELIDSRSDEVLARAADEEKPEPGEDIAGGGENWAAVEAAAQRWARLFRGFLDRNLGES